MSFTCFAVACDGNSKPSNPGPETQSATIVDVVNQSISGIEDMLLENTSGETTTSLASMPLPNKDMNIYVRNQGSFVAYENGLLKATLNYADAFAIISKVKEELAKPEYSDNLYGTIRSRIDSAYTYLNNQTDKTKLIRFNEDGGMAILGSEYVEGVGLIYQVNYESTSGKERWLARVYYENNVVYDVEIIL